MHQTLELPDHSALSMFLTRKERCKKKMFEVCVVMKRSELVVMIQIDDKFDCVDPAMDFRVGSYAFHKKNMRIILLK